VAAPRNKLADVWARVAFYTSLGFILPGAIVGGVVLGWYLDRGLGTGPFLAVVMGALGAVAGFLEILQLMARAERRESRNDANNRNGSR
jgi:F0F1-type ATP synthase assembly protein I